MVKSSEVVVRDELLEFLTVATEFFKLKETRVSKIEFGEDEEEVWTEEMIDKYFE